MDESGRKILTVKLKTLGWTRRLTGATESEVSSSGRTLSALFRVMEQKNGASLDRDLFLVLVNGRSVGSDSYQLSSGDTVTLLPVVSGG
jgi:molybdopterin converting factor small subunit